MRTATAICAALILCACTPTFADFVNESFETGDFTGWTVGGDADHGVAPSGTYIASDLPGNYVKAHSGMYAAWGKVGPTAPTFSLEQLLPVTPRDTYRLEFNMNTFSDSRTVVTDYFDLWINGSASSSHYSLPAGPGWITLKIGDFSAPPGQNTIDFKIGFTGSAPGGGQLVVSVDDFFIQPVPEPAALGFLVSCFLLTFRRRAH